MKCYRCSRTFSINEDAYIQTIKRIEVLGDRVVEKIESVIVCEDCSE